ISAANFDAHRKNAGPHLQVSGGRDASLDVGLLLPIARELLLSSETYAEFESKRSEKFRAHAFDYPPTDLAVYFARLLPEQRRTHLAECANTTGFQARIAKADRDFVALELGWRPAQGPVAVAAATKIGTTGGVLRSPAPSKLDASAKTELLFVRNLN